MTPDEQMKASLRVEAVDGHGLRFSVQSAETALEGSRLIVTINGAEHVCALLESEGNVYYYDALSFPFDLQLVETLFVCVRLGERRLVCSEQDSSLQIMFQHDADSIRGNVQRRGALRAEGRTVQLVCSLQAYLWARSVEGAAALGSAGERLKAESVSLCSTAYRLMQGSAEEKIAAADVDLVRTRAEELVARMDIDTEDARWFPSVLLAAGQLGLVRGLVDYSIACFRQISDSQERVLKSSPICAFNISLANCLLCGILYVQRSPDFSLYAERWQFVFRYYPAQMDFRFKVMEEFGKIYEAQFMNFRLQLQHEGQKGRHFKPTNFDEILDTCLRVNVSDVQKRKIHKWVKRA